MLRIAVRQLVPACMASVWNVSSPGEGDECLPLQSGYCLEDVHSKLDLRDKELSGALGLTWISIGVGTRLSAPCKSDHLFSWHYHPDGDSRLSVGDWISFIISDAQVTLLLTINQACLYTKLHKGRWKEISSAITGAENTSNDKPNLRFLRFMKLMQKELKTSEWPLCAEDEIASALGIDYKSEFIK